MFEKEAIKKMTTQDNVMVDSRKAERESQHQGKKNEQGYPNQERKGRN